MRLIDADEFKKYAYKEMDICAGDLICMIDEQTTAYDIDKVVEKLKAESWCEGSFEYEDIPIIDTETAIEIVKGGVE